MESRAFLTRQNTESGKPLVSGLVKTSFIESTGSCEVELPKSSLLASSVPVKKILNKYRTAPLSF